MTLPRPVTIAACAGLIAVPALVVGRRAAPPPPAAPPASVALHVSPAAALDGALTRDLFGGDGAAPPATEAPAGGEDDPPQVVGVVGRLPDQAVVLVRRAGGGTRSLSPGESVAGWRLETVTATAVLFVSGDRRVRRDVGAGDAPDQ